MRWFVLVLLVGCTGPAMPPPSMYEPWTPYHVLDGRAEEPTKWGIVHVPGLAPAARTEEGVRERLDEVLGPTNHTQLAPRTLPWSDRGADHVWTHAERVQVLARLNAGWGTERPIWLLFVDGHGETEQGRAIGHAQANGAFVYKHEADNAWVTVEDLRVRGPSAEHVERAVAIHEVGHVMGLVDNGIPMIVPRLAPDDPCQCHSKYETSVMYPRHSAGALEVLDDDRGVPDRFDIYDLHDLASARKEALRRAAAS